MSATCWPQSKQRVLTNSFSLGTYILIIKVALKTGNSWAFGLPSRTWSSDDYQAGASSLLKLRGTFNPPPPPPCPLVPAVEPIPGASIPVEVCSLLNLISTKQGAGEGGLFHETARSKGPRYSSLCLLDIFQSVFELNSANKTSWKTSQNLGPAPFGQKWMVAPKLWTSWNAICYHITSGVWTWLFLSSSIEMFA